MSYAILSTESLTHLTAAPSRKQLAFWATRASLESDGYVSRLMVLNPRTGTLSAWTQRIGRPGTLAWRNDGTLLYTVGKSLWCADGPGSLRKLGDFDGPITAIETASHSDRIVVVLGASPGPHAPVVVQGLPFKQDGRGLFRGSSRMGLWVDGTLQWLPAEGRVWQPKISPDGQQLAYLTRRSDQALSLLDAELWVTPLASWSAEARVRVPVPRMVANMAWSPDGRQLAVLARDGTIGTPDPMELWLWQQDDQTLRRLAVDPAVWIGYGETFFWRSSQELVLGEEHQGHVRLIAVDANGGTQVVAEAPGSYSMGCGDPQATYALYSDATTLSEVVRVTDRDPVVLTDLNPTTYPGPHEFFVPGLRGDPVQTWFLPAQGPAKGTVLSIHGGPHGSFGRGVNPLHTYLSAAGFQVIYANPHGSVGYSADFARALKGGWGEVDEQDWAAIVDFFEQKGWLDRHQLAVLGTSYGGFTSRWAN